MRQPRDAEGHFIITGPTVLSAFVWSAVAGALAIGIVAALGVAMTTLHRARLDPCVIGATQTGVNALSEIQSSPAGPGQAVAVSTQPRLAASGDGCSAGEPGLQP